MESAERLPRHHAAVRRAVGVVALANLAYFFLEFGVARHIRSVSLLADSVDFLEDASVNFLIFVAVTWSSRRRARVGMVLAAVLLLPAGAFVWTACEKLRAPTPPEPWLLSTTGLGALVVNAGCALLLAKHREHHGSLTRAAFLSARNDVLANIAIMLAGGVTLVLRSAWPDLVVGAGIAVMNVDAAREVWSAARAEYRAADV